MERCAQGCQDEAKDTLPPGAKEGDGSIDRAMAYVSRARMAHCAHAADASCRKVLESLRGIFRFLVALRWIASLSGCRSCQKVVSSMAWTSGDCGHSGPRDRFIAANNSRA